MGSKARKAFDRSAEDVKRLLEIHESLRGSEPGRKHRLEVLNKSAVVLITAFWEAYCEDIASEALDHIVQYLSDAQKLPKELRKQLAKQITENSNDLAMWSLAGDGWKTIVKANLSRLTEERNRKLNTPKSSHIDELFATAIGLQSISSAWTWSGISVIGARKKLDDFVTLRGSIAHRGSATTSCTKAQVETYFELVQKLVSKTGGTVKTFVKGVTDKNLW